MADPMDQAQSATEQHLANSLARHKAGQMPAELSRFDCIDCGRTIPAARRAALSRVVRCIDCQEDFEKEATR